MRLLGEYSSPSLTWKYVSVAGPRLEKGNRKFREKGDKKGGEGQKGEVILEKKKHIHGEEKRETERCRISMTCLSAPSDLSLSDSLFGSPSL